MHFISFPDCPNILRPTVESHPTALVFPYLYDGGLTGNAKRGWSRKYMANERDLPLIPEESEETGGKWLASYFRDIRGWISFEKLPKDNKKSMGVSRLASRALPLVDTASGTGCTVSKRIHYHRQTHFIPSDVDDSRSNTWFPPPGKAALYSPTISIYPATGAKPKTSSVLAEESKHAHSLPHYETNLYLLT